MKNFPLVVITMLTLGVLANTVSATILIDFTRDDYGDPYWQYYGHSDPRLEGWNQVDGKGKTFNLVDTNGDPAGTLSEATNNGHWIGDNGSQNAPNIVGNIGIPAATSRIGRYLAEGVSQTLGFSGLAANEDYAVYVYASSPAVYDVEFQGGALSMDRTCINDAAGCLGNFTVATDATGSVDIAIAPGDGGASYVIYSAMALQVVPEPSTLGLLGLGAMMFIRRRTRR